MKPELFFMTVALFLAASTGCGTFPVDDSKTLDSGAVEYDQDRMGPYDVIIYEHAQFRGRNQTYTLEPGQRHVLEDFVGWGMNDRLSSIRCGYRVGVALFRDRDFRGPVALYDRSTDMVDRDINDWASSLVVFDLATGGPLGVWIGERGGDSPNIFDVNFNGLVRFYPLPEDFNRRESEYKRIDEFNDNVEWVVLGPADTREYRRTNFRERGAWDRREEPADRRYERSFVDVEVYIYEHGDFKGRSVALPERMGRGYFFRLSDYNFNRIASSIAIREVQVRRRY